MPALTFLGATRTVTGSKFLVETDGGRLLVDCGLFQGLKELRQRNWQPLPIEVPGLSAVVLTHAHVDHSGYLPRLFVEGFRRRVFCTPGTADLCRIVLPDAGRIAEEDARAANRHGYSRHDPALPLFTEADAYRVLANLQPVGFERPVPVMPGVEATFIHSGHLLGSAFAVLEIAGGGTEKTRVVFSGDLGRYNRPILPDPLPVGFADLLVMESTYGNRVHEPDEDAARLAQIVRETIAGGGKLLIPAFAIGRVEEVVYWLKRLEDAGRIPALPVYVDSPMAVEALHYYTRRRHELDPEMRGRRGEVAAFVTSRFQTVTSAEQSQLLVQSSAPCIVVSSSGMATGGRVLNHLKVMLPNPRHTVLFSGYQAAGTRGRALIDGAREVKIHGEMVPVRARIEIIESMSAHADSVEILRWLEGFNRPPRRTFLVHGEIDAMQALRQAIEQRFGWAVHIPEYLESVSF